MPAASILAICLGSIVRDTSTSKTSFAGKTVVIIGANTGLGLDSAKQLVALDVSVLVLGYRNISKGDTAKQNILKTSRGKTPTIYVWQVDMASYASVKAFAEKISTELPRLDALLANAGISTNQVQVADGLESTLTVNVVSLFLLGLLAMPLLEHTANQTGDPTHLTVTGSAVHSFVNDCQLFNLSRGEIFQTLSREQQADMAPRYYLSKLILQLCIQELAEKTPRTKEKSGSSRPSLTVNCPNPGWCKTELFRQDDGGAIGRNTLRFIGRTSEVGARTLTSAIVAGDESNGRYLSECRAKRPSVFVRSDEGQTMQKKLWSELTEILEHTSPGVTSVLGRRHVELFFNRLRGQRSPIYRSYL